LRGCAVSGLIGGLADIRTVASGPRTTDVTWRRTGVVCTHDCVRSLPILPNYNIPRFANFVNAPTLLFTRSTIGTRWPEGLRNFPRTLFWCNCAQRTSGLIRHLTSLDGDRSPGGRLPRARLSSICRVGPQGHGLRFTPENGRLRQDAIAASLDLVQEEVTVRGAGVDAGGVCVSSFAPRKATLP